MKYRQWKKNYKKKHGVNPPLELDKRKQRRLARKRARQINKTLPTAAETLTAAINRWAQSIKPALATLCENVAAAFSNMAAGLREENISVTDICTKCNSDVFFSHRVTGFDRGNLAALICL